MGDKELTCKDCKFYMVAPTNPFKGTCTAKREKLPDTQATQTFIAGKLIKGDNPTCDKFEPSAGWDDSIKHTI